MLRHGVSEENLEPVLGTAALSSEFPKAKRAVALVVKLVAELERCDGELDEKFDELERKVSLRINQLTRDVQTLQAMVGKEPVSRRDTWRHRISQLAEEVRFLRSGLEKHYSKRHQLRRQEYFSSARNELFGDLNGVRTRERFQDHAVREHQSWKDSLRNVDEMTAMGKAVLESLKSQRGILKKARRKAIDLANVLGVSSSVIRMIEKRDYGDRIIVFVGMFLALLVLAFLYYVVSR